MAHFIPFLSDDAIERDAAALLAGYEHARGEALAPPIPIEDIIEKHLKLQIEFDDMHARHSVPRPPGGGSDILGAIYSDGSIFIDESLDPEVNPANEGRYYFTLAHESGHWRLHQQIITHDTAQKSFFDEAPAPTFICRSSSKKPREEWQADFFASCLLMPRTMIFAAWEEQFPDRRPRVLQPVVPVEHPFCEIDRFGPHIPPLQMMLSEDRLLERFSRPLAERFAVSRSAMRIRLEKLGLLLREVPLQQTFSAD